MEANRIFKKLSPALHFLVFGAIGIDPGDQSCNVSCTSKTTALGEKLLNLLFVSVVFGQLRKRAGLFFAKQDFKLMFVGVQLRIAKFLELSNFVFELPERNLNFQIYLCDRTGLLFFNFGDWSEFDKWN